MRSPSRREAIKLLPWALIYRSAFARSTDISELDLLQVIGLSTANLLCVAYLAVAAVTRGRRSIHDFVAQTVVARSSLMHCISDGSQYYKTKAVYSMMVTGNS